MHSDQKYSEENEDEEVEGILQSHPQRIREYQEFVDSFGDLIIDADTQQNKNGDFNAFEVPNRKALVGNEEHPGQGTIGSWGQLPNTPGPRNQGTSPLNAFRFSSGFSLPGFETKQSEKADNENRPAWYENLPSTDVSPGSRSGTIQNNGVSVDLEFLTSRPEQENAGLSASSGMNIQSYAYDEIHDVTETHSNQQTREVNRIPMVPAYMHQYYSSDEKHRPSFVPGAYLPPDYQHVVPQHVSTQFVNAYDIPYTLNSTVTESMQRPSLNIPGQPSEDDGMQAPYAVRFQNGTIQPQTSLPHPSRVKDESLHTSMYKRERTRTGQKELRDQQIGPRDMHGHKVSINEEEMLVAKRAQLVESPPTRTKFKDFYRQFKSREKESFDDAFDFAGECIGNGSLPDKIHWRVYLEMADLAKRENKFKEARQLYKKVNQIQPYAQQGWLEYSKMEEECGRLHHCQRILHEGLRYCSFSESLLTKAIKHEERMGNLAAARGLLGRLRHQHVDKAWRTILEGALLEARAGNTIVARKVFKYLIENVPWYGPIYFEAARFEEKNEEFFRAIEIVEKGLKEIPRYGPLWFHAFRLHEITEMTRAREILRKDVKSDLNDQRPRLLKNDVENEFSQTFRVPIDVFDDISSGCNLAETRGALQRAMNCISKELVWKVHFEAAQVAERGLGSGWLKRARQAYVQSVLRCPQNLRWKIWLAGARTELTANNVAKARQLMKQALKDVPEKSKAYVYLECSRLEEFTNNRSKARNILLRAKDETKHEWKVFLEAVMLEIRCGDHEAALREAQESLKIHCGTGRLWAVLVQLKHHHGPDFQRIAFREALKMVPKSGEVWCEGARLYLHPLSPYFDMDTAERYLEFAIQFTPQYGDSFIEALRWELLNNLFKLDIEDKKVEEKLLNCDTHRIEQRCVNADPNYGGLWFHCKRRPFDTARKVLRIAKKILVNELVVFKDVYRDAYDSSLRRKGGERKLHAEPTRTTPALANGNNVWLTDRLIARNWTQKAIELVDFSTGLSSVNWIKKRIHMLNDTEKRKVLFGSDMIVP